MKQPLEIRFIGMERSEALEAAAQRKVAKLDQFRPDIMTCRVTVELGDKHRQQGRSFTVRVDVTVSDHEFSVDRVHDEDAYVALREAFDDMKRQLQDAVRRLQDHAQGREVKRAGPVGEEPA